MFYMYRDSDGGVEGCTNSVETRDDFCVDGMSWIEADEQPLEPTCYVVSNGVLTENPTMKAEAEGRDVRMKRNELLAETDWWAGSDRTMTQAQIDYRQALRDITTDAGYPSNVTWPTKP